MTGPRPGRAGARAILPFAVALCAALAFSAAWPLPPVHDDAVEYLSLARNVAAGNGFSADGASPAVYRPPLFSALLGGWFLLTGTSSPESAAVFQSLLHGAGAASTYLLVLELAPPAWALGAALFLALNPVLVTRVAFVLQEPTLLLATTVAALASVRLVRRPSVGRAAWCGAAWGACILGKSVAWFAPPLLVAARWLPARIRVPIPRREAVVLLAAAVLVVAPWTARNLVRFGRLIPVNDQGRGMLAWNVVQTPVEGDPERERLVEEIRREGAHAAGTRERAWRYVLDHPREFLLERTLRNAVRFAAPPRDWWNERGTARSGGRRALYGILSALFHAPLYLALLLSTRESLRGESAPEGTFLALLYWGYWAEHAVVWGDPRFGLAVYPVLLALAAGTCARFVRGRFNPAAAP